MPAVVEMKKKRRLSQADIDGIVRYRLRKAAASHRLPMPLVIKDERLTAGQVKRSVLRQYPQCRVHVRSSVCRIVSAGEESLQQFLQQFAS